MTTPGPASGDLVRAIEDRRRALSVEGILYIRFIPRLCYVQLIVIQDGRWYDVDPGSIEVMQPAVASLGDLERDEDKDEEWRRVATLEQALSEGLVQPPIQRVGGTWADLVAQLDAVATPLLAAGWKITESNQDESWEFGDSVSYSLERDGAGILLDYYEDGRLLGYIDDTDPPDEEDVNYEDEPAEPDLILTGASCTACEKSFRERGWI